MSTTSHWHGIPLNDKQSVRKCESITTMHHDAWVGMTDGFYILRLSIYFPENDLTTCTFVSIQRETVALCPESSIIALHSIRIRETYFVTILEPMTTRHTLSIRIRCTMRRIGKYVFFVCRLETLSDRCRPFKICTR